MNVPLKTLVIVSPYSLVAKLAIDFVEENTLLTDEDDMSRANKWSLNRLASKISKSDRFLCPKHSSR